MMSRARCADGHLRSGGRCVARQNQARLFGVLGDPATVRFCHEIGLDYVSCSPFRVPIARLAAARAALGA